MKKILSAGVSVLTLFLLLCCVRPLSAQPFVTPDWAKKGGATKLGNVNNMIDMATDKHGNSYVLVNSLGYITIDGQNGIDSNGNVALVSWDCNGNFRWMKTFGGKHIRGVSMRTDTAEGVYVTGYVTQNLAYFDTDTLITGQKAAFFMLKYTAAPVRCSGIRPLMYLQMLLTQLAI